MIIWTVRSKIFDDLVVALQLSYGQSENERCVRSDG